MSLLYAYLSIDIRSFARLAEKRHKQDLQRRSGGNIYVNSDGHAYIKAWQANLHKNHKCSSACVFKLGADLNGTERGNARVPATRDRLDGGEWSFSNKRHSRTRMTEPKIDSQGG